MQALQKLKFAIQTYEIKQGITLKLRGTLTMT